MGELAAAGGDPSCSVRVQGTVPHLELRPSRPAVQTHLPVVGARTGQYRPAEAAPSGGGGAGAAAPGIWGSLAGLLAPAAADTAPWMTPIQLFPGEAMISRGRPCQFTPPHRIPLLIMRTKH